MFNFNQQRMLFIISLLLLMAVGALVGLGAPGGARASNGLIPLVETPSPPPALTPTPEASPDSSPAVRLEQALPQAEPGQPVTVRIAGLPSPVVTGQHVACLVLTDEAEQTREGPMPVSPRWTGSAETRFTLSHALSPGRYHLQVILCGRTDEPAQTSRNGEPLLSVLATIPYTITASTGRFDQVQKYPAPDNRWTAVVNQTVGSLVLQGRGGETVPVFPESNRVDSVSWSPDARTLLAVRPDWRLAQPGMDVQSSGSIEIWRLPLEEDRVGEPSLLFQSSGDAGPRQIVFGKWSPDGQRVLFWLGMLSASIQADGLAPYVMEVETGQVGQPAAWALVNPGYHSWAPDSSALAITAGGYRSAQVNKWLNLFDVVSGRTTTVISQTEQIPGLVAWSPAGDVIAYAAAPAAKTSDAWADLMTFENPAIAARRIYLLDPATGQYRPLNEVETFQDAPVWSEDGQTLYYVQRNGDALALLAADPETGQAGVVEGTARPAPHAAGYYGQSDWDDLLAYRPGAPRAETPPLQEVYTDAAAGYSLRYPAGWYSGELYEGPQQGQSVLALSSYPPDAPSAPDLGPFSGQASITVDAIDTGANDTLETLLSEALASAGPGQYLGRDRRLAPFDRREVAVDGRPALRLETMGDFSTVNHVQLVLGQRRAYILRARGDVRIFEAVASSLKLIE